jgi:hypothetical protein
VALEHLRACRHELGEPGRQDRVGRYSLSARWAVVALDIRGHSLIEPNFGPRVHGMRRAGVVQTDATHPNSPA